jgi:hypothetical protein
MLRGSWSGRSGARRAGEDAPAVAAGLEIWLGRAEFQEEGPGLVKVVGRELEVELLWHALARPARCLVERGQRAGSGQSSVIAVSLNFMDTGSSVRGMVRGALAP